MNKKRKGCTYIGSRVRVIEEAIGRRGSVRQVHTKFELEGFSEDVSARVPETLSTLIVFKLEKLDFTIAFQRARRIVLHPAVTNFALFFFRILQVTIESSHAVAGVSHCGHNNLLGQLVRDHLGNIQRRRLEAYALFLIAVRESNRDWLLGHFRVLDRLLVKERLEVRQSFLEESRSLLELPFASKDLNFFVASRLVTGGQLGSFTFLASVIWCRRFLCFCHSSCVLLFLFISLN